jgi:hypothetical protein
MTRVVIDRLRIQGLQGRAPTQAEVAAAVRQALAGRGPVAQVTDQRVTRPSGTTLSGAAQAAADAAFGGKPR